jgi:hypothetical protein
MSARSARSARPPSIRVRVLLGRWRLDRELADGWAYDAAEDRACRARQLADNVTRHQLACSLRRVVAAAESPRAVSFSSAVPVRRVAVVGWREALLGVAERLEQPGPANPCGVARTRVLLTDGTGPLYNRASERSLSEMVWWVADGLQLCPPHAWGCPVIMKLDPEHVAWTCGRCGAIAKTGDPAVRPA